MNSLKHIVPRCYRNISTMVYRWKGTPLFFFPLVCSLLVAFPNILLCLFTLFSPQHNRRIGLFVYISFVFKDCMYFSLSIIKKLFFSVIFNLRISCNISKYSLFWCGNHVFISWSCISYPCHSLILSFKNFCQ